MAIQINNSGTTGTLNLKPPTAGNLSLTLPASLTTGTTSFQTNGSGALSFSVTGLAGWTAGNSSSGTNATINVSYLQASGGTSFQGVSISGLGSTNQLLAMIPTGTTTTGDARTAAYIVDLSFLPGKAACGSNNAVVRDASTDIVNATRFINIGQWCKTDTASTYSVNLGGRQTWTNAPDSAMIGGSVYFGGGEPQIPAGGTGRNVAIAYKGASGYSAPGTWLRQNQVVLGSNSTQPFPQSYSSGGNRIFAVVCAQTTDATSTVLTPYTGAVSTNNMMGCGGASFAYFAVLRYYLVGTVKSANGNSAFWTGTVSYRRVGVVGNTTIIGSTITKVFGDAGTSGWANSVTADTTNGAININVTGQASTSIQWVCAVIVNHNSGYG